MTLTEQEVKFITLNMHVQFKGLPSDIIFQDKADGIQTAPLSKHPVLAIVSDNLSFLDLSNTSLVNGTKSSVCGLGGNMDCGLAEIGAN